MQHDSLQSFLCDEMVRNTGVGREGGTRCTLHVHVNSSHVPHGLPMMCLIWAVLSADAAATFPALSTFC